MILGFRKTWNAGPMKGKPTDFQNKIMLGEKIHTIRSGNRWQPEMKIHMCTGMRTKYYNQFNKGISHLEKCISVQTIKMIWSGPLKEDYTCINFEMPNGSKRYLKVFIDDQLINMETLVKISSNDGFRTFGEFIKWFNEDFEGQIIHWTDLKYDKEEDFYPGA